MIRRAFRDALIFSADPVVAVVQIAFVPQASRLALSRLNVPLARQGVPFTTGYQPTSLRDE